MIRLDTPKRRRRLIMLFCLGVYGLGTFHTPLASFGHWLSHALMDTIERAHHHHHHRHHAPKAQTTLLEGRYRHNAKPDHDHIWLNILRIIGLEDDNSATTTDKDRRAPAKRAECAPTPLWGLQPAFTVLTAALFLFRGAIPAIFSPSPVTPPPERRLLRFR